ncbi:MAG: hypothetical protein JWP50_255 [Phenylobacterium sp.]|nr:hypothetical protein [Phenylobacterium sp.]
MNKLLVALLATSAIGLGAPAVATAHPDDGYAAQDDWNNGGDSYDEFNQEYQHIWNGIQHGLGDGSYTPRQAQQFFRAMQQIRARADWMERSGYYDPQDIQNRLERLHDYMHMAHERGHERLDRRFGYYGYGDNSGYYNYRR